MLWKAIKLIPTQRIENNTIKASCLFMTSDIKSDTREHIHFHDCSATSVKTCIFNVHIKLVAKKLMHLQPQVRCISNWKCKCYTVCYFLRGHNGTLCCVFLQMRVPHTETVMELITTWSRRIFYKKHLGVIDGILYSTDSL